MKSFISCTVCKILSISDFDDYFFTVKCFISNLTRVGLSTISNVWICERDIYDDNYRLVRTWILQVYTCIRDFFQWPNNYTPCKRSFGEYIVNTLSVCPTSVCTFVHISCKHISSFTDETWQGCSPWSKDLHEGG